MSILTLVRHGQASFFDANYDQLSPLGERQMRVLGEYWARRGIGFDEIFFGPRVRQQRSAELAVADRTALELHWRLRNGSLTEFAFTRDRFTLDSFNAVPHLEDTSLLTYR